MVKFWGQEIFWISFYLTFTDFQTGRQKLGIILENKVFQKLEESKNIGNINWKGTFRKMLLLSRIYLYNTNGKKYLQINSLDLKYSYSK